MTVGRPRKAIMHHWLTSAHLVTDNSQDNNQGSNQATTSASLSLALTNQYLSQYYASINQRLARVRIHAVTSSIVGRFTDFDNEIAKYGLLNAELDTLPVSRRLPFLGFKFARGVNRCLVLGAHICRWYTGRASLMCDCS